MIRVMNVISDTNIGGAGRVLLNYLRYAGRERFETLVALPRGSLLKVPLEEAGGRVLEVDGIADRSFDRGLHNPAGRSHLAAHPDACNRSLSSYLQVACLSSLITFEISWLAFSLSLF